MPEQHKWPGADVPPEEAADWIRERMPDPPPNEPETVDAGRMGILANLGPCAACGRGVYGPFPEAVCQAFGFLWHDSCAEAYPFPGRNAY